MQVFCYDIAISWTSVSKSFRIKIETIYCSNEKFQCINACPIRPVSKCYVVFVKVKI